jgi:hypothetical protein
VLDPPAGNDCDPTRKAVHPGAKEIAGNSLDEDCAGGPAVRRLSTPGAEFRGGAHLIGRRFLGYFASGIDLTRLTKGAIVKLQCRGHRPACKDETLRVRRTKATLWFRKGHAAIQLGSRSIYDVKIYLPRRAFVAGAYVRLEPSSKGQKDCSGRLRRGTLRISGKTCRPAR